MPSVSSASGAEPVSTAFGSTTFPARASVIALSLLPFPALQAEPRHQNGCEQERDHRGRNRSSLAQLAAENRPLIGERRNRGGALTGPPRVITHINWKSVKVNSTENVITTAMIGVSRGYVMKRNRCHGVAPS